MRHREVPAPPEPDTPRHTPTSAASAASAARDLAIFVATTDDDEWHAGDHLIGRAADWDPWEKITVLQVLSSGKNPQRNAYRHDVSVVRVLTPLEARGFPG
jgi:hypothetical protein